MTNRKQFVYDAMHVCACVENMRVINQIVIDRENDRCPLLNSTAFLVFSIF